MKSKQSKNKIVTIICPACNQLQKAKINNIPFATYIHKCKKCDYIIMESEWQTVKKTSHIKKKFGN